MINGDADIQVWLERMAQTQQAVIVPYVESTRDKTLQYRVRTVARSRTGQSMMSQGGTVTVEAGVPAALGRMSVTQGPDNDCFVELILQERGLPERMYRFKCAGPARESGAPVQGAS